MRRLRIRELYISEKTAQKLKAKHGIDPEAARNAIEGLDGYHCRWIGDGVTEPERVLLVRMIDGVACICILFPVHNGDDDECWHLGSAYPSSD